MHGRLSALRAAMKLLNGVGQWLSNLCAEKVFKKLSNYIGDNVRLLLEREDGAYCFRFHRDRVYYSSEKLMKQAATIRRKDLLCFGTCLGKFTKAGKFFLHITALDYLAPYAKADPTTLVLHQCDIVPLCPTSITESTEVPGTEAPSLRVGHQVATVPSRAQQHPRPRLRTVSDIDLDQGL
uniref:60S ribosome subunit biogenesis protein NIP7 pre-PUA domain-containing protein n=1 Tax=Ditylenchus dipsaci TaxID=166011 RepID=A0A915CXA4_9BILA